MKSSYRSYSVLLGFVVLCVAVEVVAGWLTSLGVHTWYQAIRKPFWTPPDWIFGPVWTVLYLTMAIALWRVWKSKVPKPKFPAYCFFGIQLFLNLIWSGLFFGLRNPLIGFIDITLLWFCIAGTLYFFHRFDRLAAYMLIPYWVWVTYAWTLNLGVWWLNYR